MEQLRKPIVPLLLVPNKWEAHMQTVVIPTPSPDLDVNTLKLKLTVCS